MTKLIEKNGVKIHSTAEVNDAAEIGSGTYIWNNCQVRENSQIGQNCILSKDVYVDFEVIIGNNVKVQNGVSVYHGVTVEDDVFLGPHMVFTNDLFPRAFISDFKVYPTRIKTGAAIGANSTIVCGNTIGRYALIGAGSVVTKNVPDNGLVLGNPARLVGFVSKEGHKLEEVAIQASAVLMKCPVSGEEYEISKDAYALLD